MILYHTTFFKLTRNSRTGPEYRISNRLGIIFFLLLALVVERAGFSALISRESILGEEGAEDEGGSLKSHPLRLERVRLRGITPGPRVASKFNRRCSFEHDGRHEAARARLNGREAR